MTTSPLPMPSSLKALAAWLDRRLMSVNVNTRSSPASLVTQKRPLVGLHGGPLVDDVETEVEGLGNLDGEVLGEVLVGIEFNSRAVLLQNMIHSGASLCSPICCPPHRASGYFDSLRQSSLCETVHWTVSFAAELARSKHPKSRRCSYENVIVLFRDDGDEFAGDVAVAALAVGVGRVEVDAVAGVQLDVAVAEGEDERPFQHVVELLAIVAHQLGRLVTRVKMTSSGCMILRA